MCAVSLHRVKELCVRLHHVWTLVGCSLFRIAEALVEHFVEMAVDLDER